MNKIIACKIRQWYNRFAVLYYRIKDAYFYFRMKRAYRKVSDFTVCQEEKRLDETEGLNRDHIK